MQKLITNIVFTKNRPLQLEAYLESLYRYFPAEKIQTYVIYKVEFFSEEYESLFKKYPDCRVVRESNFHTDCLNVINQVNTKYILFGIDDVVFFDSVDFEVIDRAFDSYGDDIFGFSLRFGKDYIKTCGDLINEITVIDQQIYSIDWPQGRTSSTRYPFELCATVYPAELVKKIISGTMNNNPMIKKIFSPDAPLIKLLKKTKFARKLLKSFGYFFSPNTLESWNCRWCQNNKGKFPHSIYFQKSCASAIQVNMVNTTTKQFFDGEEDLTVKTLNEKYKQGYRFDLDFVAKNRPVGTHGEQECFKLIKEK